MGIHDAAAFPVKNSETTMQQFLADIILVVHAFYVAFVILGLVLILTGIAGKWRWIRNPVFRVAHLLAIGAVVAEAWLGKLCPLTEWEGNLREAAGGAGYPVSFVQYWLQKMIFYDFPPWVFTLAYTLFGAFVLLAWILAPPRFTRAKRAEKEELDRT